MMEAMASDADKKALEAFLLDNPELEKLEALLDEFNIFEAVGAVRQEMRHSDFLAFLLNPQQQHGLGATFARQLLLTAVRESEQNVAVTAVDLALCDLDDLEVRREWQQIDILLLDETNSLAVIVENKVSSSEHSQQLGRYWRTVQQYFPGRHIVGLFLTPDGIEPSDDRYLPIDYGLVHTLTTELIETRASIIGNDVQTLMRHYAQMLRRHIMPDSDIAMLAQRIYKKHQRALDLIFEHRPDLQSELADFLQTMIQETPDMILDHSTKTAVRCFPVSWDAPVLQQGEGWTPTGRMLLLEFGNSANRLSLKIYIGPGPQAVREKLFAIMMAHPALFNASKRGSRSVNNKYKSVYVQDYLRTKDYEEAALDDLTPKIQQQWERFIEKTLPEMTTVLQAADWLWVDENKGEMK